MADHGPMLTPVRLLLVLSLTSTVACSKEEDTPPDETAGETETESSADTDTDTGGEPFPCGELECAAEQTCLLFPQEPECTNKDENQPCPRGTTESQCGGAGLPCCCGPTPPTVSECIDPVCEGPVDCACLVDVCVPSCTPSAAPNVFICEELPAP